MAVPVAAAVGIRALANPRVVISIMQKAPKLMRWLSRGKKLKLDGKRWDELTAPLDAFEKRVLRESLSGPETGRALREGMRRQFRLGVPDRLRRSGGPRTRFMTEMAEELGDIPVRPATARAQSALLGARSGAAPRGVSEAARRGTVGARRVRSTYPPDAARPFIQMSDDTFLGGPGTGTRFPTGTNLPDVVRQTSSGAGRAGARARTGKSGVPATLFDMPARAYPKPNLPNNAAQAAKKSKLGRGILALLGLGTAGLAFLGGGEDEVTEPLEIPSAGFAPNQRRPPGLDEVLAILNQENVPYRDTSRHRPLSEEETQQFVNMMLSK
tara:strand:+ start:4734 stop:5714 length:981 start_codon:yes stop_codon:yes gene_type:complete